MRRGFSPIFAIKDYDYHYINLGLSNYLVDLVFCHLPVILLCLPLVCLFFLSSMFI